MDKNKLGEFGENYLKLEMLKFESPSKKYSISTAYLGEKYELHDIFCEVITDDKRYPFLIQCKTSEAEPSRYSLKGDVKQSHIKIMKKYDIPSIIAFVYYSASDSTKNNISICYIKSCKDTLSVISLKNSILNNLLYFDKLCEGIIEFFDSNSDKILMKDFSYDRR